MLLAYQQKKLNQESNCKQMNFKKLRKIYRIVFPIQISQENKFENWLISNFDLQSFEKHQNDYLLKFKNNDLQLFVRGQQYSDVYVLDQIFIKKEYEVVSTLIELNSNYNQDITIIDAGANVGYTSIYFNQQLQNPKIFAIEPSPENAKYFTSNVEVNKELSIKLYENALSPNLDERFAIDRSFRDGKDWSITTNQSENGDIKGISIDYIIQENNLDFITLLKIDIEGAERFIFKKDNDLTFLKKTKILALEIHDEFNIRLGIYEILKENNFILFESGELTIGVNKHFI